MPALLLLLAFAALAPAQTPRVFAAVNGASFAIAGVPGGDLARGSILTVFGENLGPAQPVFATSVPLQPILGGSLIRISSGGQIRDCWMLFASSSQLAAILPSGTPLGGATLSVIFEGRPSPAITIQVAESSFGAFAQTEAGSGGAVAFNFVAPGNEPLNTPLNPAIPNQVVTLYGTGLGPILTDERVPAAQPIAAPVELFVGGLPATVEYRGRSSCCAGVDQINFRVPAGLSGCRVPVAVRIRDSISNFTTISVVPAAGQNCSDPVGLTAANINTARTQGQLRSGFLLFQRLIRPGQPGTANLAERRDTAEAAFASVPAAQLGRFGRAINIAAGTCTAYRFRGAEILEPFPVRPAPLNAGDLNLQHQTRGFRGFSFAEGAYSSLLDNTNVTAGGAPIGFLDPGTFTLRAAGSTQIGPFTQNFTTAEGVTWANASTIDRINRAQGQTIAWTQAAAGSFILIQGGAVASADLGNQAGAAFACVVPAAPGTFTIPPHVLQAIPPTIAPSGLQGPPGFLSVGLYTRVAAIDPLPTGLDSALLAYAVLQQKSVPFE
jgi:uncharacterized protein (TIGR03437 family)